VNDINIHFTRAEFADRQQRARERMAELELDGILLFKSVLRFSVACSSASMGS
jgi:hypothetical protein